MRAEAEAALTAGATTEAARKGAEVSRAAQAASRVGAVPLAAQAASMEAAGAGANRAGFPLY